MLQVPILPDAHYTGSPGHDPTSQSPQTLPSVKAIRKPTSSSSGHDILIRVPIVPQVPAKTKTHKSTPPDVDAVRPGISNFKNVSGHDVVPVKLVVNNTSPAPDKTAPPGRNVANNSSAGHDTLLSGAFAKNVSGRAMAVPGKKVVSKSSSGHDIIIPSVKKVSNTAGEDQGHERGSMPQNIRATRTPAGMSSLRWRITTSSSVGVVSERTNTASISSPTTNLSISAVPCTPASDIRRPRTTHSSGTMVSRIFVPGTVAANLGIRRVAFPACSPGTQVPGPDRNRVVRGLASAAVFPVVQSGPKDQLALPYGLGSPAIFGYCSPKSFGNGLVESLATQVGGMLSSTVVTVASVWQSLSFTSQAESITLRCLSLSGRYLKSAKAYLLLAGLRT
jgi:hypothetical protein